MSDPAPWSVDVPERLREEFAQQLAPGERRAVHDLLALLAADPRMGAVEPVPLSVELRRALTAPATDTGQRVSILYRVHADRRTVEIIYILTGP
ncbi:hypothetical protein OG897_40670 [Streptomyces sp. NBC_00237]|uniref:hypothetical protein n=1 Tax=Streptomyces sp. NBC_00237 TaxID=2975687 RepID=UPI00225775D6|nr:hypothetical protein [Streptomyces sp. NBC_00237]MCX5207699.1 hypothetical protein [Streptomyces sp. NBC_00237]